MARGSLTQLLLHQPRLVFGAKQHSNLLVRVLAAAECKGMVER